jgi:hypothetical protein
LGEASLTHDTRASPLAAPAHSRKRFASAARPVKAHCAAISSIFFFRRFFAFCPSLFGFLSISLDFVRISFEFEQKRQPKSEKRKKATSEKSEENESEK